MMIESIASIFGVIVGFTIIYNIWKIRS
ncbi:hypothetical protein OPT79_84 [Klebsiella phage vB_KpnD_Opt-79]|nr:hypothetical protein OPT79_84 [Klebsiella phage vB_KpnD_Opt-79]